MSVPADLHNETGASHPRIHLRRLRALTSSEHPSVNIHSHLGGAVLFVAFLFTFRSIYFVHYESTTWVDTAVFIIFLCSAVFCLFSSAFYHTMSAHSQPVRCTFFRCGKRMLIRRSQVAAKCNALDYTGIVGVWCLGNFSSAFHCLTPSIRRSPHSGVVLPMHILRLLLRAALSNVLLGMHLHSRTG